MTDSDLPRFIVRKGAMKHTWMVWDRKTHGPARIPGGFAIKLSEAKARYLQKQLTREEGNTPSSPGDST